MRTAIFLSLLAAFSSGAAAYFPMASETTCPVCLADFSYTSAASDTMFDTGLDFRPLSVGPSPQPLPVCPECGLPVLAPSASKQELAAWRGLARSPGLAALKGRSSWRLAAWLLEKLNPERRDIAAHAYLKASWEEAEIRSREREDLKKALELFDAHLSSLAAGAPPGTAPYLRAELLRRLSRFKEAQQQLDALSGSAAADPNLARLVRLQRVLCRRGDSAGHGVNALEKELSDKAAKNGGSK